MNIATIAENPNAHLVETAIVNGAMRFYDFITKQRIAIFIIGIATFIISIIVSHEVGFKTLWGSLFTNLAASAVTVIFTSLIIDYLGLREQNNRTLSVASLAEDELRATCFRIKFRIARLFGLRRRAIERDNIADRSEALQFLDTITKEVDAYLANDKFITAPAGLQLDTFPKYLDSLRQAQTELEQTLTIYDYALSYSLREQVLTLRRELQLAERILGFIDTSEDFNDANISLITVTAQSIYAATSEVLDHETRTAAGVPLHKKEHSDAQPTTATTG